MILDFWATWCEACKDIIPDIRGIEQKYASRGVKVIGINEGQSRSAAAEFVKKNDYTALVLLDSRVTVGIAYGASALPEVVIIDKDGHIAKVIRGAYPDMKERIEKEIEPLL